MMKITALRGIAAAQAGSSCPHAPHDEGGAMRRPPPGPAAPPLPPIPLAGTGGA